MKVRVKRLREGARLPEKAHPGDAGFDLFSTDKTEIAPGDVVLVRTGVAVELPPGTEAQVRPRSGLALKNAVTVLNTPGTIDEGYRGEVGVILINHGREIFHVEPGMKIAQMVIKPVLSGVGMEEASELSDSSRGPGGFGSTGT